MFAKDSSGPVAEAHHLKVAASAGQAVAKALDIEACFFKRCVWQKKTALKMLWFSSSAYYSDLLSMFVFGCWLKYNFNF